jgi:hypothetical protein
MTPFQVLARVPNHIPPTLPISSSEASTGTMTVPPPPLQMAPHESPRRRELAALKERRKARLENDRLHRLQDMRHSLGLGDTENTGEGSTTTTPVPALRMHRVGVRSVASQRPSSRS